MSIPVKYHIGIIMILALSMICPSSFAQQFDFVTRDNNNLLSGHDIQNRHISLGLTGSQLDDTIVVTSDKWPEMTSNPGTWYNNFKFKSIHDFVRFKIDHNYPLKLSEAYTLRLAYTLLGYNNPADTVNGYQTFHDTLTISYNPDSLGVYQDIQIRHYSGFSKIVIVLNGLYRFDPTGSNPPTPISIDNTELLNFSVEGAVVVQPYIKKFNNVVWYGAGSSALTTASYPQVNHSVPVRWTIPGASITGVLPVFPVSYELEWTYIDDYKVSVSDTLHPLGYLGAGSLDFDFKHNSTRIQLNTNYYEIPVIYQHGYVAFRVRMIRPDSVAYRFPIYGKWSSPDSGKLSSLTQSTQYFKVLDAYMSDSLNWQYTVSFAEGGRFKHVMSFYDGMLKNRQSITRFNSNKNLLIATGQIYDYEGRPSISILPTPIPTADFRYQPALAISKPTGLPYQASDFDDLQLVLCPTDKTPPMLDSNALAALYYSHKNPDKSGMQRFVPDAGGYPFVETLLAPGYEKRIEKQGGAGDSLQIGNGHFVKNNYVGEEQMDLNRVFGPDIGWSGFYRKTISRDPNGQLSLSITDYHGKSVMSSLIGVPDTTRIGLLPNDNVPGISTFNEDFISGTQQQVQGNKIILDKNFFNDASVNTDARYSASMIPFPTGCPQKFLTVPVNYKYQIYDECGQVEGSDQGTLATLGIIGNDSPINYQGAVQSFYMEQGTQSLHKELSIDLDAVQEVVNKFIDSSENCFKKEPQFIKESVLSKDYPCPADSNDPCTDKKYQMMQELWPNVDSIYADRKYGIYMMAGNIVYGNNNSIFSLYYDSTNQIVSSNPKSIITDGTEFQHYRYQDSCMVQLPDTVWYMGHPYTHLAELSVDTFIMIFNDDIAEALLPLHPEYCDLLNCGNDDFGHKLQQLPNDLVATMMGLFSLSDIIHNDPLFAVLLAHPAQYPSPEDSLSHTPGGVMSLDSMALAQAWCQCDNETLLSECIDELFHQQIAFGILDNSFVRARYFSSIISLYLINRQRYLFLLNNDTAVSCTTCQNVRMTLVPPPVFVHVLGPNGSLATGSGSFLSLVGSPQDSTILGWMQHWNSNDTTGIQHIIDSTQNAFDSTNVLLAQGAVNGIMQQLSNCADSLDLLPVKNTLLSMIDGHEVTFGNFTPEQIRYALVVNQIPLADLCNPYLVNYDGMAPGAGLSGTDFSCYGNNFYTAAESFFSGIPLTALEHLGTQYSVTLSGSSPFENQMIVQLGTSSAKVKAAYDGTTGVYRIYIYKTAQTDPSALRFELQNPLGNTPIFQPIAGLSISIGLSCIQDMPPALFNGFAPGYVGRYTFGMSVTRTEGGQQDVRYLPGWNNKITMNAGQQNDLRLAVPPTQMLEAYQVFWDTLTVYQVKGTDHPNYGIMLRNFMNQYLGKPFTTDQYISYIESCGLGDFMVIPRYYTYARMTFDNLAHAQSFINAVAALTPSVNFQPAYFSKTKFSIGYDFNTLPHDLLKTYKDYFTEYSGSGVTARKVNEPFLSATSTTIGVLLVPGISSFVPDNSVFNGAPHPFNFSTQGLGTEVIDLGGAQPFAFQPYSITAPTGSTPKSVSDNIYILRQYLNQHNTGAYFITLKESTVDAQQALPEKQAYMQEAFSMTGMPPLRVLDTLQIPHLETLGVFSGKQLEYGSPMTPGQIQDLFILDTVAGYDHPGFILLKNVLNMTAGALQGHLFFNGSNHRDIQPNQKLVAFRCSENVFWYRYFGNGDTLYNIFVKVPSYLDSNEIAGYTFQKVVPAPGWGNSRTFRLRLINPQFPNLTLELTGYTDFTVGNNQVLQDVLLFPDQNTPVGIIDTADNCERELVKAAIYEGKIAYQIYVDSIRTALYNGFVAWLLNGHINEHLTMDYSSQRFNSTLYYYDRAGNLIRTVPPAGVTVLGNSLLQDVDQARDSNIDPSNLFPDHHKSSYYEYNSLNQVVYQRTPDGGATEFFYDAAGRIVFSQNEKQRPTGEMTYTLYDALGRIMETGQAKFAFPWFNPYKPASAPLPANGYLDPSTGFFTPYPPIVYNLKHETQQAVVDYVHALSRNEVVQTFYDTEVKDLSAVPGLSKQEHLRQRVAAIKYFDFYPANASQPNYNYAMHFSYDVVGNVKTLTRDYPSWKISRQQFKRIDYDYDLISGKVNLLSYNRGFADQYFQRYAYDDDNRITQVSTSADGYIWQQDAQYYYYQHGPLARTELGDHAVQGVDYAYTIQGWLKAVNGNLLNPEKEMGRDGSSQTASAFANDAMAFSIDYFKGDYRPIGVDSVSFLPDPGKNLYNGNIIRTTAALLPFDNLSTRYTYDQLNRILKANYEEVAANGQLTNTADYYSSYAYDPDGNLLKLVRNGNKPGIQNLMDSLVYKYVTGAPHRNQLLNVNDYAADNYDNDIKMHTDTAVARYLYDPTGNVIKDLVSGQDTIEWNHYNKVTKTRNDSLGNGLEFDYDGAGNRYLKSVTRVAGDTMSYDQEYQVRDAQGNPLAFYRGQTVYKNEKKRFFVRKITNDLLSSVSIKDFIDKLVAPVYAKDGSFRQSLLKEAAADDAWTNNQIASQPVSWFVTQNDAVRVNLLAHTSDYRDFYGSMANYDGSVLGAALDSMAGSQDLALPLFLRHLFLSKGVKDPLKIQVLSSLCGYPVVLEAVMERLRLGYESSDCSRNIDQLLIYTTTENMDALVHALSIARMLHPTEFKAFLSGFCGNSKLLSQPVYTDKNGALLADFQAALTNYCPPAAIGGFMDEWKPAMDMMRATNRPEALLGVVYDAAPDVIMNNYVSSHANQIEIISNALLALNGRPVISLIHDGQTHLPWVPSITLYKEILKYQRIYLSSHVIYGSSRLGTKDYLPGQIYSVVDYTQAQPVTDTVNLLGRRPWYSNEYQDDIIYTHTEPWQATQTGMFSAGERIGEKQYELTNHLGNVMATVSDNKVGIYNGNGNLELAGWHPALRAAYDYYPFGMLMPDRYISDTTQHCVTVSQPHWAWKLVLIGCVDQYKWVWPKLQLFGAAQASVGDNGVLLTALNPGDGMSFELSVTPNVESEIHFEINSLDMGKNASIQILETNGSEQTVLTEVPVKDAEGLVIPFTPHSGKVKFVLWGPIKVWVRRICAWHMDWVEEDQLVTICDGDKDKYRFGYNGIEKVNEIAGVGNHYTALFGEYTPRTTGRWNLDPKPNPSISPYAMYAGNPIWHSDPFLDTIRFNSKQGQTLMLLDDSKKDMITKVDKQKDKKGVYDLGIQWFEPDGKNYMKALWTNPDIGKMDGIKHFSWDDIVNYADNHQGLVGYAHNGLWNDWKANKQGADGYILSTVGGRLYWSDAVGQIPFAINAMRSGWGLATDYPTSKEQAIRSTVSLGQRFGGGLFGSPDKSNSYDNLMLLRGALYGAQRFTILRTTRDIYIEHGMKSTITDLQIKTNPVNSNTLSNPIDKQTATQYGY